MKKLREIVEATKSLHPMALHVKHVMVNGQPKYKVHAVGKDLADGIKHGEHLSDSELDDASEMGAKIKHVKESVVKEDNDFGPEADKNITVQLKKAMDMMEHGEKSGSDIEFANGQKHFVEGVIAHKVLVAMEQMKPEVRAQAQDAVYQSFAHLMAAHQMLSK